MANEKSPGETPAKPAAASAPTHDASDDATVFARAADSEATMIAPRNADAEATMVAPHRTNSDATLVATHDNIGHSLPGRALGSVEVGEEVLPAREVGRYQILGKLGAGAMATVYKAFDPSINRSLVIKFLHTDLCATGDYRQRFLREAKAAGALSHPNIVTIYDVGEIENRPYIAMELLDGTPLDKVIPQGNEMPLRDVLLLTLQLANALDYAHSKGIYHRDIKPANIMRLADGKTIKLADFGIALVAETDAADATVAGTIMGTPHYMSPEQARGEKADGRSDLWSVGVLMYQLLTGKRPFQADNMMTLLLRITDQTPKPVGELRTEIPASLRRILARSLNKQPDKRFQSGGELADAIRNVLQEIAPSQRSARTKRRGMPLKIKLAMAMAAVVALTMTLTSLYVTHRQYQAMLSQTIDAGASLAKLIAVESAHATLSEDWVSIDVSVQAIATALNARGLSVVDRNGVVRVGTDAASVGKPYQALSGDVLKARDPVITVQRVKQDDLSSFAFVTPIQFQKREIGKVQLLLAEDALAAVTRESWWLMALLLLATAAAATLATYLLLDRYARPLRTLGDSLDEIRDGRYDCRIDEARADEIGDLYDKFNDMATNLEQKTTGIPSTTIINAATAAPIADTSTPGAAPQA